MGTGQFEFEGTSQDVLLWQDSIHGNVQEGGSERGIICNLVASEGGSGKIKPPITHNKAGDPRPCSLWQLDPEQLPICCGVVMSRIRGV